LAAGANKAEILQRVLRDDPPAAALLPVQKIQPQGKLEWYLDQAAAARIQTPP